MAHYEDSQTQRAGARFIRRSMAEPMLSREHEFELATAWRKRQDEAALHELIRSYMRLVISSAMRFRHYGLPVNDLVQEGSVGLMQAAARFEPEREVRFSTYATWWIRSAIQDYILRNWSIVRTGTTASQKALFFNLRRLRAQIEEASGTSLDDTGRSKIARDLKVALSDVESMELRLSGSDQSLNATLNDEEETEWQDFLADDRAGPEDSTMYALDIQQRSRWLSEALECLDQRERAIIEARRLAEDEDVVTLETLGQRLGVSKERVRQLENRALGKLRAAVLDYSRAPRELMQAS
ncbi:RNA polymerase factor sigma-32 [Fodinicurvata halophila]|uniref:RNA polymerase factor sigma-32 n=1 Tax=Fodinicurvata halophila TaxID=1419723 RepID=A0ABV8UGH8_9PROT